MKTKIYWFPSIILGETYREIRHGQYPENPYLLNIRSKWPLNLRRAKWALWERCQHTREARHFSCKRLTSHWAIVLAPSQSYGLYDFISAILLPGEILGITTTQKRSKITIVKWLSERKKESHWIRLLNSLPISNRCINIHLSRELKAGIIPKGLLFKTRK